MTQVTRRRPFRPGGNQPSPTQPPGTAPGTANRELVLDAETDRIGEVMDRTGYGTSTLVWLRPPGGGREWTTTPDKLRLAEGAA